MPTVKVQFQKPPKRMSPREASIISKLMLEAYKGKPMEQNQQAMRVEQWNTEDGHGVRSHSTLGTKNWQRFKHG